jgi:hypothetical protein
LTFIKERTALIERGSLFYSGWARLPRDLLSPQLQIENHGLASYFFIFLQNFKLRLVFLGVVNWARLPRDLLKLPLENRKYTSSWWRCIFSFSFTYKGLWPLTLR